MEQDVDIAHSQPTAPPRRRAPPSVSEGAQLHRLVLRMVAAYGPIRPPLGRLISAVRSTTAFCAVYQVVLSALTRFNSPSHVAARIRASGSQFEFAPSRSEREQRCDAMRCDAIRFDAACNNALNLLPQEPQLPPANALDLAPTANSVALAPPTNSRAQCDMDFA